MKYTHSQISRSLPWLLSVGALVVLPGLAHASQTGEILSILDNNSTLHSASEFFRSFVNWTVVGGLLAVAFANVLRINVDTYAVKKILPTLLIAFLLANFSGLLSNILLSAAQSLNITAADFTTHFAGAAEGTTSPIIALVHKTVDSLRGLSTGLLAATGIAGAVLLAQPGGIVLKLVLLIAFLLAPVIIAGLLVVMFQIRLYALQLLIVVAPVAFMGMAFPFTRNFFQTWLKQMMLWSFMEPIAALLTAFGAIVLNTKIFANDASGLGQLVEFALGCAILVASVVVPFKMMGAVGQMAMKLGKMGALGGRLGLAGMLGYGERKLSGSSNRALSWTGEALGGMQGALYAPDRFLDARKRRETKLVAEGGTKAAYMLGERSMADASYRAEINDRAKEVSGSSPSAALKFIESGIEQGDAASSMAGLDAQFSTGGRSNLHNEIKDKLSKMSAKDGEKYVKKLMGRNGSDTTLQKMIYHKHKDKNGVERTRLLDSVSGRTMLTSSMGGAKLINTGRKGTDENGKEQAIYGFAKDRVSQMVANKREEWNQYNKKYGFMDESATTAHDEKGQAYIVDGKTMANGEAHNIADRDTQDTLKGTNLSSLRREAFIDGELQNQMSQGMIEAVVNGGYDWRHLSQAERLSGEGGIGLKEIFSVTGDGQNGIKGEGIEGIRRRVETYVNTLDDSAGEKASKQAQANEIFQQLKNFSDAGNVKSAIMLPKGFNSDDGSSGGGGAPEDAGDPDSY